MTDAIAHGALAQAGLLGAEAVAEAEALVARVRDSDIETVRVLFTDPHGVLRGKVVVASALASAFSSGISVPSTLLLKDTSGRTAFPVWSDSHSPMQGAGDVLLVPDPKTFRSLPWSPHSAWILCDVVTRSGAPVGFCPRGILKSAAQELTKDNMAMTVGLEVEFHVFEVLNSNTAHEQSTMPPTPPNTRNLAPGYQLLSAATYARLEPVMDDLRRACQGLDLPIRSMEVEMGPSQFEFTFDPSNPLTHADNMMMFRAAAKDVCAAQGLHATFMCRPGVPNAAASGWHLHQSLADLDGTSLMMPQADGSLSPTASGWIAGLLQHAAESCLLTTPTVNGYKRYRPYQLAPERIAWGRDNRGTMIRGLMSPGDPASRIENRVAETGANPYLFFASQVLSGLDGVRRGLVAPAPSESPYADDDEQLPKSLGEAIGLFEQSDFYRAALGKEAVDVLVRLKRAEWDRYLAHVSDWEQAEYFGLL